MAHDDHGHVSYFAVFIALCICTLLSFLADVFDIRAMAGYGGLIVIVLSIAVAKALFVMSYFMHLKFEGNWKFVLLAPTIILAIGLPLALLPDIGVHYYTDVSPQLQEAADLDAHDADHADGAKAHEGDH